MEFLYIMVAIISVVILILFVFFIIALLIHNKLFKNRFTPDPLIKYYTKEEFNLDYNPIEFKCDNDTLKGGLYSKGEYNKDSIVVFCHGMWSTIDAYTQDIAYLCENGFLVLGFNYTGTDTSEGKSIKGLGQSLKCVDAAINYIKSNPSLNNKKIYVVGHSWGGYAACNIMKYHKDVEKIVALAPFISVKSLLNGMMEKAKLLIPFICLTDRIKVGTYSNNTAINSFKDYSGNALVIHSKNDHMVKYQYNTKVLEEKNFNNISFLINEGKYHNPNYSDDAIKALLEYSVKSQGISEEALIEYKKTVDFHAMGELDINIMNEIVNFLK